MIKVKRVYEAAAPTDGYRPLLIESGQEASKKKWRRLILG